jgi:hypothetical protein
MARPPRRILSLPSPRHRLPAMCGWWRVSAAACAQACLQVCVCLCACVVRVLFCAECRVPWVTLDRPGPVEGCSCAFSAVQPVSWGYCTAHTCPYSTCPYTPMPTYLMYGMLECVCVCVCVCIGVFVWCLLGVGGKIGHSSTSSNSPLPFTLNCPGSTKDWESRSYLPPPFPLPPPRPFLGRYYSLI